MTIFNFEKQDHCLECGPTIHKRWIKGFCGKCYSKNQSAKWRANNPLKANEICKKWRDSNKEQRLETNNLWRKNNPEANSAIQKRAKIKRRSTPQGCINHRMSSLLRYSLKNHKITKNKKSWEDIVGYTEEELYNHIEKLFIDGMSWDLFLRGEIHIDHKIPQSYFKFSSIDDLEFKKCWALDNLQPLWKIDNIRKQNKIF